MLPVRMTEVRIILLIIVWVCPANSYNIDDAYLGCFYDDYDPATREYDIRVLSLEKLENDQMTIARCITYCVELQDDTKYAGLEARKQCFCGTADDEYDRFGPRPASDCSQPCAGNANQTCGGDRSIAVYNLTRAQSTTPTGSNIASTVTNDYSSPSNTSVYGNTGTSSTGTRGFVVGALCGVAAFGICLVLVLVIMYCWKRSKEGTRHAQSQQADKPNEPFYETIDEKGPVYNTANMDSNRLSVHSGDGDVSFHGSIVSPKGQKSTPVYSYADVSIDLSEVGNVVINDRRAGDEMDESGWVGNEAYSTVDENEEQQEGWNENVTYTSE